MTISKRSALAAAALLLAGALAAVPAAAQSVTVPQGDDGWVSQGGGLTNFSLSGYPISSAFPGGSITGSSTVNLKGSPINSSQLGSIDTIVTRTNDVTLSGAGASGDTNLTVRAVSLVSDSSNVTISGHGTYSLAISLSSSGTSTGTMHMTLSNSDGGTFTSSFTIVPKLVFTNVSNPSDVVTIDCGVTRGCPALTLSSTGTGWTRTGGSGNFSPSSKGVTPIQSGIAVNGYTTIGNSNFYAGFSASASTGFPPAPGTHTAPNHSHVTLPPTDCATSTNSPATGASAQTHAFVFNRFCHAIFTTGTIN
jgi:hypothetical protein